MHTILWDDRGNGVTETTYHDTGKVSVTLEFDDGSILLKEDPNDRPDTGFINKVTGRSRDR